MDATFLKVASYFKLFPNVLEKSLDYFMLYSGIPIFLNSKKNRNWFEKLGVRKIVGSTE